MAKPISQIKPHRIHLHPQITNHGEIAFTQWSDNRSTQGHSFFSLLLPGPVDEPSLVCCLALGFEGGPCTC
jgi:hypothetical protein